MAHFAGTQLYMTWKATVISGKHRSFTFQRQTNQIDETTAEDAHRSYINGIQNSTGSYEGVEDGTTLQTAIQDGDSGTLIWGPEGTATGKKKYTATANVSGTGMSFPYEDVVTLTADFQFTSAATESTW